ncbi:hypothetical protein Vafri_16590, partial [Volvox africanus]
FCVGCHDGLLPKTSLMSFVRLPANKHMAGPLENPPSFWLAKAAIAKSFLNRKPPINLDTRDNLSQIVSNLYLSSCHLEAQKDVLIRKGVTHILQVGKELSPTHPTAFTYKHIPVYDLEEEDLVKYFPECFEFINAGRENGAVLVHCAAGVSRSASVVIAYLMTTGVLSLEDARAAVKAARPAINPNQGFLLQLQLFQDAGCSAEGWQQWDLERFLRVRSAAYSRRGTPAALVVAAAESSGSIMRGACELSPPNLIHEDSISPAGSPTHSPSRTTDGSLGPFFSQANTAAAVSSAITATAPAARADASSSPAAADHCGQEAALPSSAVNGGGGFGRDGSSIPMRTSSKQETKGMATAGSDGSKPAVAVPCSQGAGAGGSSGRGNRMAGPSYRLPTLPAMGGAAAGVVMAAASATWAAIAGASSSSRETVGFWPPRSGPRPAPQASETASMLGAAAAEVAAQPTVPGGPSPVLLPSSRPLQRHHSADDAVGPVIASMRAAATSLPSIGVLTVDATNSALGTMHDHTSNPNSCNKNTSLIPAVLHSTAAVAPVSPTSLPSRTDPLPAGLVTTPARTTSGITDASSLATRAAVQAHEEPKALPGTSGSMSAWARPEHPPIASHTGHVPTIQGAIVDTGLGVGLRAGSVSPMTAWTGPLQAHGDWVTSAASRGAGGAVKAGHGSIGVVSGFGTLVKHVSYYNPMEGLCSTGDVPAADGTETAALETPDPRASWPLEVTPSPPLQQQQRHSQRSIDTGEQPTLSPIPSDCSDEAGGSDADEGSGGGVTGGVGVYGRTSGSERQLRVEDPLDIVPAVQWRTHGFLRRSLSDRLQGMLIRAYRDGVNDTEGNGRGNTSLPAGGVARHITASRPSPITEANAAAVATTTTGPSNGFGIGDELTGGGRGNGISDATQGVGLTNQPQLRQPRPMVPTTRMLFAGGAANATAPAVVAADPATQQLCAGSGVSRGFLAPVWPDVSAHDGSSSNNDTSSTAASRMSGAEVSARAGGGFMVEDRSDATSSAITAAAGRTDGGCPAASQDTPWQGNPGLRTEVSVSPNEAAYGSSWAAGHQQHWTLLSILAPAGLDRTPSKIPQTTVAAAGCDGAASNAVVDTPAPLEGTADWMGLGPCRPEARTATPYDGDLAVGDAAGTGTAARSTVLKHLAAAQMLSYAGGANSVPTAAATTTLAAEAEAWGRTPATSNTLHEHLEPDMLASRTPGSIGSSVGPPWGPHLGACGDWCGPGRPPASIGLHCVRADGVGTHGLLSGSQHVPKVPPNTAAKVASRLATATFADSTGGNDGGGSWDGPPAAACQRCERGRSTSSSGDGNGYRGSEAAAITYDVDTASTVNCGSRGECGAGDGGGDADGNDIDSALSLQRSSAPIGMALGLQTSSPAIATAAALPPADLVSSPTTASSVDGPVRSLRLSIRNLRRPSGSGGDSAGAPPADTGRGAGGSGTPIHKRVLRSLTFFLGRSSESPTAAAAAAAAGAITVPGQTHGLASGEGQVNGIESDPQAVAVPVARRRLWTSSRSGGVAKLGGATGADSDGSGGDGGETAVQEGISVNRSVAERRYLTSKDQDAVVTGAAIPSATPTQLTSSRDDLARTAVRGAVQLPPAASTFIGDAIYAPGIIRAGMELTQSAWDGGVTLGAVDGDADGSGRATIISSWGEVNSSVIEKAEDLEKAGELEKAEEEEEEEAVNLDLLPNAPFRWDPSHNVGEWPRGVAPLAIDTEGNGGRCVVLGSTGLAGGVSKWGKWNDDDVTPGLSTVSATMKTAAALTAAPAAAPAGTAEGALHRNGPRRVSLDGCSHGDDSFGPDGLGPLRPTAARAVPSAGPGLGPVAAATTASYLTNLVAVANSALLPTRSSSIQLESTPPDTTTPAVATAKAIAVTTATSSQPAGPASAPVSAAIDSWWCTSDAGVSDGDASGVQRSVSLGPQGLTLPLPLGTAITLDQPPGRQVMAIYDAAAAATRGLVVALQAHDPSFKDSGSNSFRAGPAARQPRSSYSGALSMLPPMSRHELEALLGAGTVGAGAPQERHPIGADKLQLPSQTHTYEPRRGTQDYLLDRASMPLPLPSTQPLPAATHTQQPRGGGVPCASGAAGEGAGAAGRPGLPAWGGSRSAASLLTTPSDPEFPVTGLNGPTGSAQHNGSGQSQQQFLSGLGAGAPSVQPGRATVRSSSTGSSAAAHAAAARALEADSASVWEHLRAVRQHQRHLMQQHQQSQQPSAQQQQLLLRVQQPFHSGVATATVRSVLTESLPLPGMAIPETGNRQGTHDTVQSKPFSTVPSLEYSPGVLAGPLSGTAIGWEAPATSTASAAQPSPPYPATPTGPAGSPTSSLSTSAAATTAIRMSLSPAVSSGGSSSSTQSPRAPPAMPDIPDKNPPDVDTMDGPSQPTAVGTAPVPAPVLVGLAFGPGRGRLDASLLKPVLGRRLLPMPSPSRIISSAAATPRGSAGGAGASTGFAGAGMMFMPISTASAAVQLSPERSSPQPGAVDAVTFVSAGPSLPQMAALRVPEPCCTYPTDPHVLPPHEVLPPAGSAAGGRPSAIAVTSFVGMAVDGGCQGLSGGGTSAESPLSVASSSAGGHAERPLDSPGAW